MYHQFKILPFVIIMFTGIINAHGQKSCCANTSKTSCSPTTSDATQDKTKACCSSAASQIASNQTVSKETTSGCTPSSCRGAQTKFGEAKVISDLRVNLIALKTKMENHQSLEFTDEAISVHDIIGETDDESLEIVSEHVAIIETELYALIDKEIPSALPSQNKAIRVSQLQEKITVISELL